MRSIYDGIMLKQISVIDIRYIEKCKALPSIGCVLYFLYRNNKYNDAQLLLCNGITGEVVHHFLYDVSQVYDAIMSDDDTTLYTLSDNGVSAYSIVDGSLIAAADVSGLGRHLRQASLYCHDDRLFVFPSGNVFQLPTLQLLEILPITRYVYHVQDGRYLYYIGGSSEKILYGGYYVTYAFRVYDLDAQKEVWRKEHSSEMELKLYDVINDGKQILASFEYGLCMIFDAETGDIITNTGYERRETVPDSMDVSPDEMRLALFDSTALRILSLPNCEEITRLDEQKYSESNQPQTVFWIDDEYVLVGRSDRVSMFSTVTGEKVLELAGGLSSTCIYDRLNNRLYSSKHIYETVIPK